ncbi:MAG TPA: septum site-determining protein MinC [Candidatus Merdicola faecigallinarum]|uniref:Probable septum site-determining protein MinC n=1 Tax=Candidatus Merdicola faecigallinarum TaxID=2840862 RepID=A0A9D1M144_9FIRM|nr:septum site-determining protein MinC [Candidatus Merdicola faecigallinarum]
MTQCLMINLRKERIVVRIMDTATQKDVLDTLRKKLPELKRLYQKANTPIFITGKILKNKEIAEIQNLIKESIDVQIDFDSPKVLGLHGIKRTYHQEIKNSETKFYKGSLRSGQRMEFEGSLVIIGDVNSGAEVIASENVIVVGNLRGVAHAGAKGNKEAIIAAERIDAPQVRISNKVKELEKEDDEYNIAKTYVYIDSEKDEIIVE